MGRKAKCRICGKTLEINTAYKIVKTTPKKVRNIYYCSEKEYQDWVDESNKNIEEKNRTYMLINNIFGREITNTALYKEVSALAKIYTFETILDYLEENYGFLSKIMQKDFENEYNEIRYFATILKNNLYDFQKKNIGKQSIETEHLEKTIDTPIDIYNVKFKRKNRKRTLEDFEKEVGDLL